MENYFDHEADIGIIGHGKTIVDSFTHAAFLMFSIMTDLTQVRPKDTINFTFIEPDVELAFVTWLNLLLAQANSKHMIFSEFTISQQDEKWICQAVGEQWHDGLIHGTDVKGATLTMLSVKRVNQLWEARCVVDV